MADDTVAPLTPVAPSAGVKATVASTLVAANTKTVGITGWVLTIADFVLVAVLPDLPASLRAHMPPLWAHAAFGAIGATAALLGRMVRYDGLPTPD